MKKKYAKWSDYERVQIIRHHRMFGKANMRLLTDNIKSHSPDAVMCELMRFDDWIKTGIMQFGRVKKPGGRKGTIKVYTRIILTLGV